MNIRALHTLLPDLRFPRDYTLDVRGEIAEWKTKKHGQPTPEELTAVVLSTPVPTLTRKQLRLMLLSLGVPDAAVTGAIEKIPDEKARQAARIEWEDSQTYHHDHPLVLQIGAALGLDADAIKEKFRKAAQ